MDKRKLDPQKVCRYGSLCFRLNPTHFDEYSHPHLEEILRKGKNSNGIYDIPSGCPKDKVLQQLKIVELKSKDLLNPAPSKVAKFDVNPSKSADKKSSPISTTSMRKPEIESPRVSDEKISYTAAAATSSSSMSQQQQKKPQSSPSKSVNSDESNLETKRRQKEELQEKIESLTEQKVDGKSSDPVKQGKTMTDEKLDELMRRILPVILPKGKMAEKLQKAAPYNFFLTTVTSSPDTHSDPLSVTFQELLDPSLGELESSVQINFMVDIAWLVGHYTFARCNKLPLLVLYGDETDDLKNINKRCPNVTSIKVNLPGPIGVHHTKMMLFFYKDNSMRVVVSTANLYEDDWHNRVQGLWISDKLPAIPEDTSHVTHGESVTKFREDLMRYMIAYDIGKLQPIITRIRRTDFSGVKVFFISSVPASHRDSGKGLSFGHPKVGALLSANSAPIDDSNPILLQCSSIGSLGPNATSWLTSEIAASFRRDSAPLGLRRMPQIKLVYPSLNNVLSSHDGMIGGGCLPYDGRTHEKQTWLKNHLNQWKAQSRKRNQAMPHIKSYFRYSDRGLYWFILTSANLSKSAWGSYNKGNKSLNPTLRINSYEAGVMFFPRVMIERDRFPLNSSQQKSNDVPIFPLPYDIPTLPYGAHDVPYCAEYLKSHIAKYGLSTAAAAEK